MNFLIINTKFIYLPNFNEIMFKPLKKAIQKCKEALESRNYTKAHEELTSERIKENYLQESYEKEFRQINLILGDLLSTLTYIAQKTAQAHQCKMKGIAELHEEEDYRLSALMYIKQVLNDLDKLEQEIRKLSRISK